MDHESGGSRMTGMDHESAGSRMNRLDHESGDEDPPPIGGSWRFLYAVVVLNLALLILLFYAFTKAFS